MSTQSIGQFVSWYLPKNANSVVSARVFVRNFVYYYFAVNIADCCFDALFLALASLPRRQTHAPRSQYAAIVRSHAIILIAF